MLVVTLVVGCWQMLLAAYHSTNLRDRGSAHIAGRGLPHVCGRSNISAVILTCVACSSAVPLSRLARRSTSCSETASKCPMLCFPKMETVRERRGLLTDDTGSWPRSTSKDTQWGSQRLLHHSARSAMYNMYHYHTETKQITKQKT